MNKIKIFISYSHNDESHVSNFIKHFHPLTTNDVEIWYDRKITPGENHLKIIDQNIEQADIICLFVSASFIASEACFKEMNLAYELKELGKKVISIILSPCAWKEIECISTHLALPHDGKPISEYQDHNAGWYDVYSSIKEIVEINKKELNAQNTESFNIFLNDTELLSKAHSSIENVLLDDIYIYPDLDYFDTAHDSEKINSKDFFIELIKINKILIAGENQSGKTSLAKMIYKYLRKRNYFPIYLVDDEHFFAGFMSNRIEREFKSQYSGVQLSEISTDKIIPIVDNFHYAKQKDRIISELTHYKTQILFVDDIFSLNISDEMSANQFQQYKIREFSPLLQNELINKWMCLQKSMPDSDNEKYKCLDAATEWVNTTLGKILANGIMPSYPFYILTALSSYLSHGKPLDQEITSQGYCYQSLIYLYLRKEDVKTDEIDTYINFMSVIAYYFISRELYQVNEEELQDFITEYMEKYNLPVSKDTLLKKLNRARMITKDSFGKYSFNYPYILYYFAAKYFAEHYEENKDKVSQIIANLHVEQNAYIAIFIAHHTRNNSILDEIVLNAMILFENVVPTTLSRNELAFFDKEIETIVQATLPQSTSPPEAVRKRKLQEQERIEELQKKEREDISRNDNVNESALLRDIRRSIKTVEVMGCIVKNRSGSLEKQRLEQIMEEALNVHLKILTSFFEVIKTPEKQKEIVSYISDRIKSESINVNMSDEKVILLSHKIFWNINFHVVSGFINKIVHSIGSDKLQGIIDRIYNANSSPALFLIKHGVKMWYSKCLDIDIIAQEIVSPIFSITAKNVMKYMVISHCSMHQISHTDRHKIISSLKLNRGVVKPHL